MVPSRFPAHKAKNDILVLTMRHFNLMAALVFLSTVAMQVTACGTMRSGRPWGADAWVDVSWKRVGRAAWNAALDLQTLIPAASALVFTIDDWDQETHDWATEHAPVFGCADTAEKFSDSGRMALLAETFLTGFLTPSGEDRKAWTIHKLKGLSVEAAGVVTVYGATALLKTTTHRLRPDGSDDESFPSGHTTTSFAACTLANDNLNAISMNPVLRRSLQGLNLLFATGVGWGRVESGRHYPSEVLAGAAIGHFLSSFVHDAFLGLPEESRFGFVIVPLKGGVMGGVSARF